VYPVAEVRRLCEEALSADDLSGLCFDVFPEVYGQFAPGQTTGQRVLLLVEHAAKQKRLDDLVAAVERVNPSRAREFRARLGRPDAPAAPPAQGGTVTRTIVELDLVGYSTTARLLEQNMGSAAVAQLNEQIQTFVDAGLRAVGVRREDTVGTTTGDGAILLFDGAEQAHGFAAAVYAAAKKHSAGLVESARRRFRMGAATGEVTLRPRPGGGFDMAGITIADAVRLEAATTPGTLLIDLATYKALPPGLQAAYGEEVVVRGKRDETYRARRCVLDPDAAEPPAAAPAPKPPPAGDRRAILGLMDRVYPEAALDRLMFLLEMPIANQPARALTHADRCQGVLTWASSPAGPGLARLEAELRALVEKETR
jgi:hypothetical protein